MAFIGEIRPFAGSVAPNGWRFCNGAALGIAGNDVLASILGITYGGDGVATVKLPDLRGRCFIHGAPGFVQAGQVVGGETAIVDVLPRHTHVAGCSLLAENSSDPNGGHLADAGSGVNVYQTANFAATLDSRSVSVEGGGQPHDNMQPFLVVQFIICISGGIPPITGVSSGGAFTDRGGMIQLVAFSGITMAGYLRTDGAEFLRATYTGLFSLIGTLFGVGDGSTTANLPNLLAKTINGAGTGSGLATYAVADVTGAAAQELAANQLPVHGHQWFGFAEPGNLPMPLANVLASSALFRSGTPPDTMRAAAIIPSGVGGPPAAWPTHENRPPSLAITALIAVDDVSPDANTGDILIGPWVSAPTGYVLCDGSSYATAAQPDLFAAIGYTYGHGSGSDFKVPDGRSRILIGAGQGSGSNFTLGQTGGNETVTLGISEMPPHSHQILVSGTPGSTNVASGNLLARDGSNPYRATGTFVALDAGAIPGDPTAGQPHDNIGPQVAFNFFIKL